MGHEIETNKLLGCPCCGSKNPTFEWDLDMANDTLYTISCYCGIEKHGYDYDKLVKSWNKRPNKK